MEASERNNKLEAKNQSPTKDAEDEVELKKLIDNAVITENDQQTGKIKQTNELNSYRGKISNLNEEGYINRENLIKLVTQKLHQWVIFSIAAALLPIGINAYRDLVSSASIDYSLISHGELVLVCAAISAEAIGDLVVSGKTKGTLNMYSLGTCLLVFFVSSAVFVIAEGNPRRPDLIAISSLLMFVFTLFAGGSCKALAEV